MRGKAGAMPTLVVGMWQVCLVKHGIPARRGASVAMAPHYSSLSLLRGLIQSQ